jgi:hypothetical protein
MMAYFKLSKETVLMACEAFLADSKDEDLYSSSVVQRVYDILKTKAYNYVQSVSLDDFELELLSDYFQEV